MSSFFKKNYLMISGSNSDNSYKGSFLEKKKSNMLEGKKGVYSYYGYYLLILLVKK